MNLNLQISFNILTHVFALCLKLPAFFSNIRESRSKSELNPADPENLNRAIWMSIFCTLIFPGTENLAFQ